MRSQAEFALQVEEDRLRLALDAAELGSFMWYPDEDRTDPDSRMLELFGVQADSDITLEEAMSNLIQPDDRERYGSAVARAVDPDGDGRLREEIRITRPNGDRRWLVVFGRTTFSDRSGGPTRMAGIVADITRQRLASEAQSRLASLVSTTQDAVMTVGLDGRFRTWNEAAQTLFGYSAAEAIGQPVSLIVPSELQSEMKQVLSDRLGGEPIPAFDTVRKRKDGSLVDVSIAVSPIFDDEDRLVASSAVLRDITRRKEIEAEQREQTIRKDFLVALSDVIRPLADPFEIQRSACQLLGSFLKVDRAFYGEITDDGSGDEYVVDSGFTSSRVQPFEGRIPLEGPGEGLIEAVRTGQTVSIDDVAGREDFTDEVKAVFSEAQISAAVGVPLVKDRHWVALFSVHSATPRSWSPADLELIEETAERTWAAVERARAEQALRRSEGHIRAIYEGSTEYMGLITPGGTILDCNRASLEFAPDIPKDDIVGKPFWEGPWWATTPGVSRGVRAAVSLAAAGEYIRDEVRLRRPNGDFVTFDFSMHPIRDERGKVVAIVPEARDITEIEKTRRALIESEERFRSLANASPTIIWTADVDGKVTFRNDRWLEYAGLTGAESAPERTAMHPDDIDEARDAWRHAVETGEDHEIEIRARRADGEYRWFLIRATAQRDRDGSIVQWLGSSNDIHDQKRVEERLRDSESEQRTARHRAEFLAELMSELEQVDGLRARARRLLELLVPSLAPYGSISWASSGATDNHISVGSGPTGAEITLVLAGESEARLSLAVEHGDLRSGVDEELLGEVAQRAGLSLENARLRQEEKRMALRLQRALLPNTVLTHPEASIAARYEAASDEMVVGGDWYDSFVLADGRIGLAVGDVVGHGLDAAAAMGRLRIALAAIAAQTPEPGVVLSRLGDFASGPNGSEFATAVYAVFDPETSMLEYAAAGHPPMLLINPDGSTRWLEAGRSQPLGFLPTVDRPLGSALVEPGSTLVLYSDGLIERRKEPISAGMARLEREAHGLAGIPESEVCDRLLGALGVGSEREDDVVVMAVRLGAADNPRFHHRLDAKPDQLAPLRSDLREWVASRKVSRTSGNDLLISVGEACANSIEHAYYDQSPGLVDVEIVDSGDGWASVRVEDFGEWLPEIDHDELRGRGTGIMKGLVEDFARVSGAEGTVVSFRVRLTNSGE